MIKSDDILDNIFLKIGGIGKHQIIILSCLCLTVLLHSATHIAYVFTSMDSDYRCLIPQCEEKILNDPTWLKHMVPFTETYGRPSKCLMYNQTGSIKSCSKDEFNNNSVVRCKDHYFYDNEYYIGREYNLLCDNNLWTLSLVGSVNTFGMFMGLLISGFISDKYGRKHLLLIGISSCGAIGLLKTFAPTFYWFILMELIEAILSAGTCGCVYIIAVELVVPNKRALVGSFLNTAYCSGEVFVALVAWYFRSWRKLIYFTYGPCALLILLYFILPESIRWYLTKGKIEETKKALRCMAKTNNKPLSEDNLEKLDHIDCSQNSQTFIQILKSKRLFWRFLNCSFGWITCAFLFYGITLNSVTLYGNKYLDFILISAIELPAYWFCNLMLDKIGRKNTICGSYSITLVSCIFFMFGTKTTVWFNLIVFCMGKFGATAAFQTIYVITSEVFPTSLRHTVMGLCSTLGRLGSITSPQTPLLGRIWPPLPMLLFAMMAGIACVCSIFLPETTGLKLPDSIEEAEKIK